jgi:glutathione S-transferase
MSSYRLYWYPGTCARVPFVALEEIGEPYELILEDRIAPTQEYLQINPKGSVPTLIAGDRTITENAAIQTYLARRHPAVGLLPTGSLEVETAALEIQSWFGSTVHPLVRQLRVPQWYCEDPETHAGLRASALVKLERVFTLLEDRLENREWLFEKWSILDAYLLWLWFRATGSGMDGTMFPRCATHAMNCEERPSLRKVLQHEEAEFSRLREEGKIPDWVRPFQAGHAPTATV